MHIRHRAPIQIPADPRLLREDASEKTVLPTVPVETPLHTKVREALEAVGEVVQRLVFSPGRWRTTRAGNAKWTIDCILFSVYIKRVFFLFYFRVCHFIPRLKIHIFECPQIFEAFKATEEGIFNMCLSPHDTIFLGVLIKVIFELLEQFAESYK